MAHRNLKQGFAKEATPPLDVKNGILDNDRALDPLTTQKFRNRHLEPGFATSVMEHGAGSRGNGTVQDVGGTTTEFAKNGVLTTGVERFITEFGRVVSSLVKALPA